jgi:molybdenum cofactor cytidylyltransferase
LSGVDAILMASGFSRRFGRQNKLLAPFAAAPGLPGKPLAAYTLDLACSLLRGRGGCFDRVFFVAASPQVAALAEGLPVTVLINRRPNLGQRESVRLGVAASDADFYLFFPCDQPRLDAGAVRALLAARGDGPCIVQPVCRGVPVTPALFSRHFRGELLNLPPGGHARDIKARHPDAVVSVRFDNTPGFEDIDECSDISAPIVGSDRSIGRGRQILTFSGVRVSLNGFAQLRWLQIVQGHARPLRVSVCLPSLLSCRCGALGAGIHPHEAHRRGAGQGAVGGLREESAGG